MARKASPRPNEHGNRGPRGGTVVKLDSVKFELICERLAEHGSKYKACEEVGFEYSTVQSAIRDMLERSDDSWQVLWDYSYDKFRDRIEAEAVRRHVEGVEQPVFSAKGELVGHKREFSDRLGEVLLKGHFPERYRERLTVSGGIGLEPVDAFANLTPGAKREIRAIIMRDLEEQRRTAAERAEGEVVEGRFVEVAGAIEDMREQGE